MGKGLVGFVSWQVLEDRGASGVCSVPLHPPPALLAAGLAPLGLGHFQELPKPGQLMGGALLLQGRGSGPEEGGDSLVVA